MKRSIGILVGLLTLLVVTITASAVTTAGIDQSIILARDHACLLGLAPMIFTTSITPQIIEELKLKFGHINIITIVVEEAVFDIDQIPESDLKILRKLGIDTLTLVNKGLEPEDRLKALDKLSLLEDKESIKLLKCLSKSYTGAEISPAEKYQFLVKRPDRGLIKMLLPLAKDGKLDEFSDKAVKNLVVGGDMDSLDDGLVFMGLVSELKGMITPAQSFLSKA